MCLAIPGKIVKLKQKGKIAVIDYGKEKREAVNLINAEIGSLVIVQHKNIVEKIE
ncbi:MAG TPA: HypC/HybG/HupF family hydrogenase formation chaperone [archaeon]|uniref:HypC/HybG/HupF family hydrogenase formation chaperone n=1 Tax=Candidatus Iainarchaeum sp. TaxID=3101447 RepID=A0A8T4KQU4_9ARCH|nr:HypC/HybG/HupF family hydrogenase formation chaperone [Candidatus Diapherotrites archaeon]HLD58355.1 HypC/HybG/HupF family hydrogenase formation chaperone [archaeon]